MDDNFDIQRTSLAGGRVTPSSDAIGGAVSGKGVEAGPLFVDIYIDVCSEQVVREPHGGGRFEVEQRRHTMGRSKTSRASRCEGREG